jgi:hypothetical protein
MPAKSEKQKQFMDAAAHNPKFAKAAGVPVSVAKEFSGASKGMKFGKDTNTSRPDLQKVNKPKTLHGKMSIMKEGGIMATKKMNMGGYAGGGMPMVMKDGKKVPAFAADGEGKMKKGGMTMKKMANGGITTAKMGAVKSGGNKGKGEHAIQSKGLSKGTMISMKGGTPLGMKKGGKTMAYGGKAC